MRWCVRVWRGVGVVALAAVVVVCAVGQGPSFGKRREKVVDGAALVVKLDAEVEAKVDEVVGRVTEWDGEAYWGVVAVMRNGVVVYRKGFGRSGNVFNGDEDKDSRALDGVSITDVASISKQFLCAAIMRLQMQGKLKISDPVAKWFPETGDNGKRVTLEMLMSHTSGMPTVGRMLAKDFQDRESAVRAAMLAKGYAVPKKAGERAGFSYSNAGYVVLAAVIEKATGKTFEEVMHEEVFARGGLKTTGLLDGKGVPLERGTARVSRMAAMNKMIDGVSDGEQPERVVHMGLLDDGWGWGVKGPTGVLTCADELMRWHLALNGDSVMDEASKKEMFTVRRSNYALGWIVEMTSNGEVRQSHSGSTRGYKSNFARYPESNSAIVILTNENGNPIRLHNEIEKVVFAGTREEVTVAIKGESVQWSMRGTAVINTGLVTRVTKREGDAERAVELALDRWAPQEKAGATVATIGMSVRQAKIIASMLERRASMADEIGGGGIGAMLSKRAYVEAMGAKTDLEIEKGCEVLVLDSYSGFDASTGRRLRDSRMALTVSDTEKKATPLIVTLDRAGALKLAGELRGVVGVE